MWAGRDDAAYFRGNYHCHNAICNKNLLVRGVFFPLHYDSVIMTPVALNDFERSELAKLL